MCHADVSKICSTLRDRYCQLKLLVSLEGFSKNLENLSG